MKNRALIILVFIVNVVSCSSDDSGIKVVNISGSSTIAPLISEIAKQYEEDVASDVRVDVQAGGSSRGFMDVRVGISDIGMVSRKIKEDELDVLHSTIAIDGLAIIVNSRNPISSISSKDVVKIYNGAIENWSDLGGKANNITVVNKAEGRSTLEVFSSYFKIDNRDIKADVVIGDNQQGIHTVAGNENAIGYVSIGTAEYEVLENNVAIKLLELDGVAATTENVSIGKYGISRELNLIYSSALSPAAEEFIRYINSSDTESIFRANSFIKTASTTKIVMESN